MSIVEHVETEEELVPPKQRMTEDEFAQWALTTELRVEWVDGEVIVMAPVSDTHSDLNGWLVALLRLFTESRDLGVIRGPEFMIRLTRRRRVPDILFIAKDRINLLKKNHLEGAPDLAIEIISPDSLARDWRDKYNDYEAAGVREYWVIDPASEHAEAYALADAKFARIAEKDDRIISTVLAGLYIRPSWLWKQPLPRVGQVLQELGITL